MAYQIKSIKFIKGFSLIELLVVIGIFLLILGISDATYSSFRTHSNLEVATNGVVEAIRLAESNATSGKGDAKWGVKVTNTEVTIFKGDNYAGRETSADQVLGFSGGLTASGLAEIVFEKLTGETSNVGTVTLVNSSGTKNININAKGTLTY